MSLRRCTIVLIAMCFAAGAFAQNQYDGLWRGTTSQGREVAFEVKSNKLTMMNIDVMISSPVCSTSVSYQTPASSPIAGNAISVSGTADWFGEVWAYALNGTFASMDLANGSLTFSVTGSNDCNGSAAVSWTATRGGICAYAVSPLQISVPASGGIGTVTVTGIPGACAGEWSAASDAPWLHFTSAFAGSGAGPFTVEFTAASNPTGAVRTTTLLVAGQTVTVTQAAGEVCSYSIEPLHAEYSAYGGNGAVVVTGRPTSCIGDWMAVSDASWVTLTSPEVGFGVGPITITYNVSANATGSPRTAKLTLAGLTFPITQSATNPVETFSRILPVVASTPGAYDSYFRTSIQLHNRSASAISGRLLYHPAGVTGTGADPSLNYTLGPGQTADYFDVLPVLAQHGVGTLDVMTAEGEPPMLAVRMYNDAGDAGTSGMAMEAIPIEDALHAGDEGVILAPINPDRARLNIGVRTLSDGASVMVRVIDRKGVTRTTLEKSWTGTHFEQVSSTNFTGIALGASDAIIISVNSGHAIFYGATTDNTTQDPSIQFAHPRF